MYELGVQKVKNMILIYLKKISRNVAVAVLLYMLLFPVHALAQERAAGLSLSVSPTLFEMAASPSQVWNSTVKVINNNPQQLVVYAQVVNFAPQGESGSGKFLPVFEDETDNSTLAQWIHITNEPVAIQAEQSVAIPFEITVPDDAAPGGHFAAILIGTKPIDTNKEIQVRTSQVVASLFFVRVAGDVQEEGIIREFRTVHGFVDTPKADFEVRFENKGNVHLQPQGEIQITNMWGKERGIIPINRQTHFGNVLPESIRKFEFSWTGEPSLSDIGRYKAELTLAYGSDGRKFVSSVAHFYVIPLKGLIIVLGTLLAFILFASWSIKIYVRKMLALAGVSPQRIRSHQDAQRSQLRDGDVRIVKNVSINAPVKSGVTDLRNRLHKVTKFMDKVRTIGSFIVAYKIFFICVAVFVAAAFLVYFFTTEVLKEHKDYEVVIDTSNSAITLSSEDILYERSIQEKEDSLASSTVIMQVEDQMFSLVLVNSSDTPGLAASMQKDLESSGYAIDSLRSDFEESKDKTVIVYDVAVQDQALALSKRIGNALLSANPETNIDIQVPRITVYIGNDYEAL